MSDIQTRVVFMGTPEFAVPTLETLAQMPNVEIVSVYTSPDAVSGRGSRLLPSVIRTVADEMRLPVRTPSTLRDPDEIEHLVLLEPDLVVVVAYGFILPREVLDIPKKGSINIHASLLPQWRGAAPIQRALLEGDAVTGVSLMRMEEGLDTGDYCAQTMISLEGHRSFDEVQMTLARMGAHLLKENFDEIVTGTAQWTQQNEDQVTYASKIEKRDILLSPSLPARELHNRIRASNDRAPARMRVQGKDVRVLSAEKASRGVHDFASDMKLGSIRFKDDKVIIAGSDPAQEVLVILDVKPAGGREMPAFHWAHGMRFEGDVAWE